MAQSVRIEFSTNARKLIQFLLLSFQLSHVCISYS
jgi:hypothetical protein